MATVAKAHAACRLVTRSHALVAAKPPKKVQAGLDPGPLPQKRRPG